jgi:hypothetical protein
MLPDGSAITENGEAEEASRSFGEFNIAKRTDSEHSFTP